MIEMTDTLSIVFGIIGAAIGVSSIIMIGVRAQERKLNFYNMVNGETRSALECADRVLAYSELPEALRKNILLLLVAHARPEFGRQFANAFGHAISQQNDDDCESANETETFAATQQLRTKSPRVAQDAHRATVGLVLALIAEHASRLEVVEATSQVATNPDGLITRISRLFQSDNDDSDRGIHGGRAVHAAQ